MKQYVAAMDIGTSGCKSIIVDENGAVVSAVTEEYPLYSPKPGWNEQDPEDWWRGAYTSMRKAIQKSGLKSNEIKAVSLSGQMHGLVAMDKDNNVIRRAFLWNDQRCAKQCQDVLDKLGGIDGLVKYTNNNLLPGYQGGKILWLREVEPENYAAMVRAILPKDYIRFKLSGNFYTDVSDASGTGFFDVKKRQWSYELLDILGLPRDIFPEVVESDVVTGTVQAEAAALTGLAEGTLVVGGGGDSVIQTTGMGLIEEGILGLTIGTAGIVAMGMSQYLENNGGTLQFFCNNQKDLYHIMGVMLAGGGSYQWYRNTLCESEMSLAKQKGVDPYQIMNVAAKQSPAGARRLIYLPYLSGERCPYSDPNLRACFIGLTQGHGKGDISRSVMEGVTYGMRLISESILKLKPMKMEKIIVSGGGSKADLWRQILSDIFQLPVYTVSGASEGGAYGACMVAGVGAGIWSSLKEACNNLKTETVNEPQMKNKAIYDELYGIYADTVPVMKTLFDRISE
ncbi:MAG: xylulokinase [Burkholderiales bacterium]